MSSEQVSRAPVRLEENVNVASISVVVVGAAGTSAVIVVVAGPTTTQVKLTGVGSAFRLGSTARTSSVCVPGSGLNSAVFSGGDAQLVYSGTSTGSSAHSNVTPGSLLANVNCDGRSPLISAGGAEAIEVSGAVSSLMVHVHVAGSPSTSRCCLVAVTSSVCSPAGCPVASARSSAVYVCGDSQKWSGPPSSEHWSAASMSSTVNVNVAVVSVVATAGPEWIVTTGGVTSPLAHSQTAGSRSTAPIGPFARTSSWCSPNGAFRVSGFGHASNGARSSEHSNVAPSAGLAAKVKCTSVSPVSGSGPLTIVVSGPASVVNRCSAGVGSTFSNSSMARTSITCSPPGSSSTGR